MQDLLQRWISLWERQGVSHPHLLPAGLNLIDAYGMPDRHYHNQTHLRDVLAKLDWAQGALAATGETAHLSDADRQRMFDTIEVALWYHDAVYDARAKDNEAQSRDLLLRDAQRMGFDPALTEEAAALVELTARHGQARSLMERIMADCDLAILGAPPAVFKKYDEDIRKEYAHVPAPLYKTGRAKVMAGFAAQERLFKTQAFAQAFGAQAKSNLAQALHPSPLAALQKLLRPFRR